MELEESKKLKKFIKEMRKKNHNVTYNYNDDLLKDLDTVLQVLENSIPKEKIENKIKEYTNYLTKGEDCTYCNNTCRNYARCMLLQEMKRELLEE